MFAEKALPLQSQNVWSMSVHNVFVWFLPRIQIEKDGLVAQLDRATAF